MPPQGFKTITLPRDVVDSLKAEWEKRRNYLRKKGVRSFSGFLTMVFYERMRESGKERPAPKKDRSESVERLVQVGECAQATEK